MFADPERCDGALGEIAELAVVLTWRTGTDPAGPRWRVGSDQLAYAARLTRPRRRGEARAVLHTITALTRALATADDPAPLIALALLALAAYTAAAVVAYRAQRRHDRVVDHVEAAAAAYPTPATAAPESATPASRPRAVRVGTARRLTPVCTAAPQQHGHGRR